jgi:predicted GNAT family N-acyltransferase
MVQFVILEEQEVNNLYALRQLVLRDPLGLNLYAEDLEKEKSEIKMGLVDTNSKQLIACVQAVLLANQVCKIRQMAVHPQWQQQGWGASLLHQAHEHLKINYQVKKFELHARETAITFYEKLNYQPIGETFLALSLVHIKMSKQL